MKSSIYLAGPEVFFPDAKKAANELKAICDKHGLLGIFPTDANHDKVNDKGRQAGIIYHGNVRLLDKCDGVIANMMPFRGVSMDVGTAFEIGYAIAQGKPVFGWSSAHDKPYEERVVTMGIDDGMSVESFGITDNLMIVVPLCDATVHSSFESAAAAAGTHFASK